MKKICCFNSFEELVREDSLCPKIFVSEDVVRETVLPTITSNGDMNFYHYDVFTFLYIMSFSLHLHYLLVCKMVLQFDTLIFPETIL